MAEVISVNHWIVCKAMWDSVSKSPLGCNYGKIWVVSRQMWELYVGHHWVVTMAMLGLYLGKCGRCM